MSNEGIQQATMLYQVRGWTRAADQEGAANKCKDGMATAEPMSVCGRAKRQSTIGNGMFLCCCCWCLLLLFWLLFCTNNDGEDEEEDEEVDVE